MITVITIADQHGSEGSELARLVAQRHGWKLLDRGLVERVARVADLGRKAERHDLEAAQWCNTLRQRGVDLDELCPCVAPRWFGEIDLDSIHELSVQLIRVAAESGECVIAVPGAQCLLQNHPNVLNVLVYASFDERTARVRRSDPEYVDVPGFLRQMDLRTATYMLEHYENEWLHAGLVYDLCANTSIGVNAAAALIDTKLMFTEANCTPASREFSPCHHTHHQL